MASMNYFLNHVMFDDEGEHKKRRILNNEKNYILNICREVRMFIFSKRYYLCMDMNDMASLRKYGAT
jgi:hypothetical protein